MLNKETIKLITKKYGHEFALNEINLCIEAARKDFGLFFPVYTVANSFAMVNRCSAENRRLKEG